MIPGAHDDHVRDTRAGGLDVAIAFERAEEILGVEPAADGHHRRLHVLQVGPEVLGLPVRIVSAVLHHLVPERDVALVIAGVGVGERAELEEEVVAVGRPVLERRPALLVG